MKMKLIITELSKSRTQYSFLKRNKKEMCGDTEKHTDRKRKEMTLFIKRVQAKVVM